MSQVLIRVPLTKTLSEDDLASIEKLSGDLKAIGVRVERQASPLTNELIFEYDSTAFKRGAGRKRKEPPPDSIVQGMTQEQLDYWLLNNSAEMVCKELGIARATVFRRRAEARERLAYTIVSLDE